MIIEFSIIVPIFNAEKTLGETLQSIENQSYKNFEVILVNDVSQDKSLAIAKEWRDANPDLEVKIISKKKNKGLGATRNTGIKKAKKEWISLLDADDIWDSQKLKKMADFILKNEADVCYHSVTVFGLEKERKRNVFQVASVEEILKKGSPLIPSASIIKKEICREFPFSENRAHHGAEDIHLWVRLLHAEKKFRPLDETLTRYRETGGMSTHLPIHLKNVFRVLEDLNGQDYFDELSLARAKKRKFFEAGRFWHKRGRHQRAHNYYSLGDLKSMKIAGLRFLNFLGISI